ncbi:UNKNOWN [Stylonychia lemnae]|uniref:Transmembrane protein n=1 Tax=Stylonychia lemnae TaxID=5949 RepID=A0A078A6G5_STYLE|nr:UNKNOWN [Stylonychia lemnae]|eukprot:CDW77466.1 UNKNOWN [Stylonychia lemnae]
MRSKKQKSKLDILLWDNKEEYYNNLGYSVYISFAKLQIARLIMIVNLLFTWGGCVYINMRKSFLYLNFWALSFTCLAFIFLFLSSGRQKVERILTEEGKIIPKKERSELWKIGLFFYTMAWPLVFASNLLFFTWVQEEQVCQTYIDFGFDMWRSMVLASTVSVPLIFLLIDFCFNKLVMSYRQIIVNYIFICVYMLIATIGSFIQDKPIYGDKMSFFNHSPYDWDKIQNNVTQQHQDSKQAMALFSRCKNETFKMWTDHEVSVNQTNPGISINSIVIQPDKAKTSISVGIIFLSITVAHFLIAYISNWKADKAQIEPAVRAISVEELNSKSNRDTLSLIMDEPTARKFLKDKQAYQ